MASVATVQSPDVARNISQNHSCWYLNRVWNFIYSMFEAISAFFSALVSSSSSNSSTATRFNERVIVAIENDKGNFRDTHDLESTFPIISITCIKIVISGILHSFYLHRYASSINTLPLGEAAAYANFKSRIFEALPSDFPESPIYMKQYAIEKISTNRFTCYTHHTSSLVNDGNYSRGDGFRCSFNREDLMDRIAGLRDEEFRTKLEAGVDARTDNLIQPTDAVGRPLDNLIILG